MLAQNWETQKSSKEYKNLVKRKTYFSMRMFLIFGFQTNKKKMMTPCKQFSMSEMWRKRDFLKAHEADSIIHVEPITMNSRRYKKNLQNEIYYLWQTWSQVSEKPFLFIIHTWMSFISDNRRFLSNFVDFVCCGWIEYNVDQKNDRNRKVDVNELDDPWILNPTSFFAHFDF